MRRFVPYVAAVAAVALTSVFIGFVVGRTQIANISMLYLVAVLLVAVAFGTTAAIVASVLAFLTFDWFFVPPTHQLIVADAEELFSLALFLITAVVTGTLAARERARAQEAEHRERDAKLLYEAAFLMAEPELERALAAVAEHFRAALDLDALAIDAEAEILPRPATAARDETARAALGATTGNELRMMDQHGASRRIRLVGARTGSRRQRLTQVIPITASGQRIGRLLILARERAEALSSSDERLLAIAAAPSNVPAFARRPPRPKPSAAPTSSRPSCCTRSPTSSGRRSPRSSPQPAACGKRTSPGPIASVMNSPARSRTRRCGSIASSGTSSTSPASRTGHSCRTRHGTMSARSSRTW